MRTSAAHEIDALSGEGEESGITGEHHRQSVPANTSSGESSGSAEVSQDFVDQTEKTAQEAAREAGLVD